jgi:hypothetical protein
MPKRKAKRGPNPGIGAEKVENAESLNEEDYENATTEERLEACGVITGIWAELWMLLAWVGGPGWTPRGRWLAYLTAKVRLRGSEGVRGSERRGGAGFGSKRFATHVLPMHAGHVLARHRLRRWALGAGAVPQLGGPLLGRLRPAGLARLRVPGLARGGSEAVAGCSG